MVAASTLELPRPGIFYGIPFAEYLQIQATNFSTLKEVGRSPLHYRHRLDNAREPTGPMTLGRMTHTATLEPHRFADEYAIWDFRTDDGKVRPRRGKDFDAFVAANAGKQVVLADELSYAKTIAAAVRRDPRAMRYLSKGKPEVTLVWVDEDAVRPCKGRVDWVTTIDDLEADNVHCLVGLKTAKDIRMREFGNACARLGYHLQWAWYRKAYEQLTGFAPKMVEIVVESYPPFDVAVFQIPSDVIELGEQETKRCLEVLGQCEASNEWPGSMPGEQLLSLPAYMFESDDDLEELGLEQ